MLQADVLKTTLSSNYIKNVLIENYSLKNINDVFLIKSGINDVYKIITTEKEYIFKIYHQTKKINDLENEIKFIQYLKDNNILVPHPFNTINNNCITSINYPEGVKYAVLTNSINGIELTYKTTHDAYFYGQGIAKLHDVSKNFSIPFGYKKYDIDQIMIDSKCIIENLLSKYYPSQIDFFSNFSKKVLEKVKKLNLPKQYCHNDLHGGNAIKSYNNLSFFDFDFFGYGYTIYELAVFKWSCMLGNRFDHWEEFIKGYESIIKVNAKDFEFILYFVAIRDIIVMSHYVNRIDILSNEVVNRFYIEKRIAFLKSINENLVREN